MAKIVPEDLISRLIEAAIPFTATDIAIRSFKALERDDGKPRMYGRVHLKNEGPPYTDHDLINLRQCIDELKAL